eukprot:scaffold508801_cov17-Prasinocladus_malaysianus.AAC.2
MASLTGLGYDAMSRNVSSLDGTPHFSPYAKKPPHCPPRPTCTHASLRAANPLCWGGSAPARLIPRGKSHGIVVCDRTDQHHQTGPVSGMCCRYGFRLVPVSKTTTLAVWRHF